MKLNNRQGLYCGLYIGKLFSTRVFSPQSPFISVTNIGPVCLQQPVLGTGGVSWRCFLSRSMLPPVLITEALFRVYSRIRVIIHRVRLSSPTLRWLKPTGSCIGTRTVVIMFFHKATTQPPLVCMWPVTENSFQGPDCSLGWSESNVFEVMLIINFDNNLQLRKQFTSHRLTIWFVIGKTFQGPDCSLGWFKSSVYEIMLFITFDNNL